VVVVKQPLAKASIAAPRIREVAKERVGSHTLVFSIALILLLLIFLIQTTQIYLTKNHIFQLEKQLNTVQEAYNAAHLKVAQLKSPERIIPLAEKCGLTLPREDQFIAVYYH